MHNLLNKLDKIKHHTLIIIQIYNSYIGPLQFLLNKIFFTITITPEQYKS